MKTTMKLQHYEAKREELLEAFRSKLAQRPELRRQEIKLSWSD
jgi:hypothetical protein